MIPADTRLDYAPAPDPVRPRSNALSWRDDWFFFYAAWIIAAVVVYGFAQTVSQRLLHASVPRLYGYMPACLSDGYVSSFCRQPLCASGACDGIAPLELRGFCSAQAQPCIDRRIDDIATLLEASGGSPYAGPTWLGRPQIWEMLHARWQVVSQAGRAPLLAAEEQAEYGFVYALFADVAADEDREQIAWARLRALESPPNPSATLRDELRLALQEARLTNWDIKNLSSTLQTKATKMSLAKWPAPRVQADTGICFPTNTPRSEALNRLSASAGHSVEEP